MRRAKGLFQVYTKYISCLGKGRFGSIIFPFALAQVVILPYIFMIGVGAYIGLVFQQTWWLFGIALFFIPKLGSAILGMCSTQVVMAMSPFHRTGAWRTMPTAREGLRDDMEIENLQNERSKNLKEELDKDRERKRKVG